MNHSRKHPSTYQMNDIDEYRQRRKMNGNKQFQQNRIGYGIRDIVLRFDRMIVIDRRFE